MAVNPVQPNTDNKNYLSYRDAKGSINTQNNTKPLNPQGHLVHDTLLSVPKYWFKDFVYDMRAIKEGFKGNTNDHQQGRLNDVGLKLGGIGIAAYLASRTSDPKLRLMEYIGLGSFLTAMSLYPVLAINIPSRIVHGFDIGKEYIDDQGRKKSVFQDSNYIPFDMYKGDFPGEDLDIIGDRMGIPRDIKNRHDLIKEQMRKIATQNNTLWMLTAGFATPVMAALMCVGLEKLLIPAMEGIRNYSTNSKIGSVLKLSESMPTNVSEIGTNKISEKVEKILKQYEGKELPKEEFDKIIEVITEKADSKISNGIKEDLTKLIQSDTKFAVNSDTIISTIKEHIPAQNKTKLEKIFVPTADEINTIINRISGDSKELTEEQVRVLKSELKKLFTTKGAETQYQKSFATDLVNKISASLKQKPVSVINESQISQIVDFAKIIGDFKIKEQIVDKCISNKFEEAPQTVLANSYERFENTLFDVLNIKFKDMKQMKESPELAKEILEKKLEELTKDNIKYENAIKKLSKVMAEMDTKLYGKTSESKVLQLINATENVYNNTALRLNKLDNKAFAKTINSLIEEEITEQGLKHKFSPENIVNFLDGTMKADENAAKWSLDYAKANSKGVGSSKMDAISRIANRYQGVRNSFNRMLLTMDVYKRGLPEGGYALDVAKMGRDFLLSANSSQFTQKFNLTNNPELYRDIMYTTWGDEKLTTETKNVFENADSRLKDVLERLQKFIKRTREVMGQNNIDFTKPHHVVSGAGVNDTFAQNDLTRRSKFDLVAQDPITMVKKASEKKYGNLLWLRRASAIGASVLGVAVLAQFAFGRIKNPHNIQKQVSDENS